MYRHWDLFIKPALECIKINHIVEVGAEGGLNTENLISYCQHENARLTLIDCYPTERLLSICAGYNDFVLIYDEPSLDALRKVVDYEAVIIDGDHNWYTVYNELQLINNTCKGEFPLVFFHDVAWPYARRDLYYTPEQIPREYRHDYKRKGIIPDTSELTDNLGYNESCNNALHEGGPRNGVLTAIEDFINHSNNTFRFATFNGYNGIGVLATESLLNNNPKLQDFFNHMEWVEKIGIAMQNEEIKSITLQLEWIPPVYGTIYFDEGYGFSEDNKANIKVNNRNLFFQWDGQISQELRSFRVDPVEGYCCVVRNLQLIADLDTLTVSAINGIFIDGDIMFDTTDPNILVNIPMGKYSHLHISGTVIFLDKRVYSMFVNKNILLTERVEQLRLEHEQLTSLVSINEEKYQEDKLSMIAELNTATADLSATRAELSTTQTELVLVQTALVSTQAEFNTTRIELFTMQTEKMNLQQYYIENTGKLEYDLTQEKKVNLQLESQVEQLNGEITLYKTNYDAITNSRSWKITKPLRFILGMLKGSNK